MDYKLIIGLLAVILIAVILVYIVKRIIKIAIVIGICLVIFILVSSAFGLNYKGMIKEGADKIVGAVIGIGKEKAKDYIENNINMSKIYPQSIFD